jgi:hypothetical protein
MAISTTTFDQRLARIAAQEARRPGRRGLFRRARGGSRITFPLLVGLAILLGGTAYAYAATHAELRWILEISL